VCRRTGDPTAAAGHWREALAVYTTIGVSTADRVRHHLITRLSLIDARKS